MAINGAAEDERDRCGGSEVGVIVVQYMLIPYITFITLYLLIFNLNDRNSIYE